MGYAYGQNNNGREIGYGVKATCDQEGCEAVIDRGVGYLCGEVDGADNAGMEGEPYCGDFFCGEHMTHIPSNGEFGDQLQVCVGCASRQTCPSCNGECVDQETGEDCELCDTHGQITQRDMGEMAVVV